MYYENPEYWFDFFFSKITPACKILIFRPKAALFYVHWELSELVFVRASVKKELFSKWFWFEKHNEIEHVYAPWAWMYNDIVFENAFWLQKELYAPCFASTILLSDKHPTLKVSLKHHEFVVLILVFL